MSALPTKRQFLNSVINPATGLPYASLTRGRFSAEAEALAASNTDKWAEAPVVVKTPKAPKVKAAPTVTKASAPVVQAALRPAVDPKAVRAWAKQNGHTVGERGRIHGDVVSAFLAAGGQVANLPRANRPTPLLMPRVRPQTTAWAVEPSRFAGRADTRIARKVCGSVPASGPRVGCQKPVASCTCSTGPVAPHWTSVAGQPMDLTVKV